MDTLKELVTISSQVLKMPPDTWNAKLTIGELFGASFDSPLVQVFFLSLPAKFKLEFKDEEFDERAVLRLTLADLARKIDES